MSFEKGKSMIIFWESYLWCAISWPSYFYRQSLDGDTYQCSGSYYEQSIITRIYARQHGTYA